MYNNRLRSLSANIRSHRGLAAATALALVWGFSPAGVASAADTSPGKNSAFVSASGVMTSLTTQATAVIERGKKNTVLAIEASYSDGASYPTAAVVRVLGLRAFVNGFGVQPNPSVPYQYITDCGFADTAPVACTVTGTFWFDIDAAELAHPGNFVDRTLVVELQAGDLTNGAGVGIIPMDTSLTVRMQKK